MREILIVKDPKVEKAKMEILAIRDEVALVGANDFEIPTLNSLVECLEKGECSIEYAIKEARNILLRKQDYH